jgi:hypothetical protein
LGNSSTINYGDIPAPFIKEGASGRTTVAGNTIEISGTGTYKWDSRIGIVVDNQGKAVKYSGNACATIPVG